LDKVTDFRPEMGLKSLRIPPSTRWATTLSSKVNFHHITNFRALGGANLVTFPSQSRGTHPACSTVWVSPVTTNHAAKGSVCVNLRNAGNLKWARVVPGASMRETSSEGNMSESRFWKSTPARTGYHHTQRRCRLSSHSEQIQVIITLGADKGYHHTQRADTGYHHTQSR